MFDQLGSLVARRRAWILVVWVVVVAAVHMVAPRWNSVTKDGDFAYLPQDRTSVRGNQLLSNGFPDYYSKSQLALVLAREDGKLKVEDYKIGDELLRRYPAPSNEEETPSPEKPAPPKPSQAEKPAGEDAPSTTEAKGGDGDAKAGEGKKEGEEKPENESTEPEAGESEKNAPETENASEVKPAEENTDEYAGASRQSGSDPAANEEKETKPAADKSVEPPSDSPVSAVWHYDTPVIKSRLVTMGPDGKGEAAMIVLHLRKEFMAIENMKFVESVYDTLDEIRARPDFPKGLKLGVTGSAAIGADMLLAAKESIRNTEWTTIALVFLILLLVYRAPGLVLVPLVTIGVSVILSMDLVALAASWADHWAIDFKVFKTTRIFIVVILFGAGTDYCLFLIARYKEELQRGLKPQDAIAEALGRVGNALAASALTTVLGLGMLFFADFGKFASSGPTIALCLLVTLLAALTLTPAVLCAVGPAVFWPFVPKKEEKAEEGESGKGDRHLLEQKEPVPFSDTPEGFSGRFWDRVSRIVTRHPGVVLIIAILLMCPLIHPVRQGFVKTFNLDKTASQTDPQLQKEKHSWTVPVSYNFLKELPPRSPSVQGMQLLEHYFSSIQTDPITVVAYEKGGDFGTNEGGDKISSLTKELFKFVYTDQNGNEVRPIVGVRSLTEPLGDTPGIFNFLHPKGLQKMAVLKRHGTYGRFVSTTSPLAGQLTRFDVITAYPPFSPDNLRLLDQIEKHLQEKTTDPNSEWYEATFHYAGNTAGIRDLKEVTIQDNLRIQMLVVIAVLIVLLVILRRPWVCLYLIVSVLFGYYVTIGATELIFAWLEGPTFTGLDWKVPIFLFVILVAVGEDYNIYLTTRVFEEQRRFGPMEGLRIALLRTGGIITSCGVIMAGTFISMATGTLSMMQQLGFALAFGVLLDTFIIRTILVPAFFALGIKPGKEETTEYTEI